MINKKIAFTLFELLVSISIIGILVAVAATSYGATQKKARDSRRIEDMNAIQKAAEIYYSQHDSSYPLNTTSFGDALQKWPVDPKGVGYTPAYAYTVDGVGTSYCACAYMDNSSAGNSADATCAAFADSGAYYCVKSQQ